MTMSGEAPQSATLCGINCPVAVFGPAKPLFLCGGEGQKIHQGRDLSLVTRFADSYSTYGWLLCHFTHVDNSTHKLGLAATRLLRFSPGPRAIVEPDERPFSTGQCLQVLPCDARLSRSYPVH